MQTRAIGVSVSLEGGGLEEVHVRYNAAYRSPRSAFVHRENLQMSIGNWLTIFGDPELVINMLRDALKESEAALAEAKGVKEVA